MTTTRDKNNGENTNVIDLDAKRREILATNTVWRQDRIIQGYFDAVDQKFRVLEAMIDRLEQSNDVLTQLVTQLYNHIVELNKDLEEKEVNPDQGEEVL
ncbi:hypothetical protein J2T17_006354 [Paenibacillus mucilaginosus]|uniref:hypothetical protein n=1 Tax=Paenibacillus mucilaginosus TaxID=61624 RepID=UPI003D1F4861